MISRNFNNMEMHRNNKISNKILYNNHIFNNRILNNSSPNKIINNYKFKAFK